jgi:guanine deaminase
LIEDAQLVTMDRQRRVIPRGHLLIRDGRIAAIGDGPYTGDRAGVDVRHARHRLIIPGLVNAHYHSYGNLLKAQFDAAPLEVYVLYVIAELPHVTADDIEVATALGAIELLTSGCTAALDHLSQTPAGLAIAASVYRRAGMRCLLTPQFADLPYAATLPAGAVVPSVAAAPFSAARAATAEDLLAQIEAVVQRCHRPDEGITVGIGPSGPQRCSEALLVGSAELARRYGLQWHTHVLESRVQEVTAQERYGQSMLAYLDSLGVLGPTTSLAHCIWTSERDLDLIARQGTAVAHVPVANLQVGDGIMPFMAMRRRGIPVGIGTDTSACCGCQSMFEATKLTALLGRVIDPDAAHWPSAMDALEAATRGGARILGLESEIGSLEIGKSADLVFLRTDVPALTPLHDPVRQVVFGRPEKAVDEVWVRGQPVVVGGRVTGIDEAAVLAEASERGVRLFTRCQAAYAEIEQEAPALMEMVRRAWAQPSAARTGRLAGM